MDPLIRFSSLVRHGLRFRSRFELIKKKLLRRLCLVPVRLVCQPFPLERLRRAAGLALGGDGRDSPAARSGHG